MAYSEDVNVNMNVMTGTLGGLTAITSGMSALTSNFSALGTEAANTFGSLDALLVTSTVLIAGFAVESAKAFGEYEQGMKIVQTVSNQTGAAMNELSAKANEMSVAYRTSIDDITDGLQTLGRAGLNSANEQLEVLESGLQTAKLEGRSLNGVLEELIQNTAMLGGDLKSVNFGEQSEYVNSLLVGTSMTAPITSHDISQTLQYAGGTAAAAGANIESAEGKKKLEDLMGTVAAFAQKGVTGSMAGTALRAFFTKPASQDKSVTTGLEMIGLTPDDLWEDGGESMKSVSDQIGIIQRQMDALDMSTMDRIEVWGKIVGAKMGQQMMKLDSSSIKDLTRDIESAQSAEDLATQTLQTYTQKLSEMQQQGEVAYRALGEKTAFWLTPVVEGITLIEQALSNPYVNTGAFALVGALLSHGFRKAYGMAQSVYGQIRGLFNEVIEGIQNINSMAGGSAPGFSQSASQVDFLNRKLIETDSTLQAIQAKALGIRPGYIMPGMHGFEKVPAGTLKAYEENVVVDQMGIMGGAKGQIYSGDNADSFKSALKQRSTELEEELQTIKTRNAEEIASLEKTNEDLKNGREKRFEQEREQAIIKLNAEIDQAAAAMKKLGIDPTAYNQLKKSGYFSMDEYSPEAQYMLMQAQDDSMLRNEDIDAWALNKQTQGKRIIGSSFDRKKDSIINSNEMRILDLKNATAGSEAFVKEQQDLIKKMEKEGITKLQTRVDMLTKKQFEAWINGIDETSSAAQQYAKSRTLEMMERHPEIYEKYDEQGYVPTFRSKTLDEPHINSTQLGQLENMGTLQQYVDADQARLEHQKKIWNNELTFSNRAKQLGEQRMNAWSNAVKKGTDSIKNMPSQIKSAFRGFQLNRRSPGEYIKENASAINRQAAQLDLTKLQMTGMSAAEALDVVAKELGMSRTELSLVMTESERLAQITNLSGNEIAQLGNASRILTEKIIEATAAEGMDAEMTEQHAIAVTEDMMATTENTLSQMENTGSNLLGSLSGAGSKVVGLMGGPFMVAMMGVTVAMEAYNAALQNWQKQVQEASEQLSESQDQMSTTEENIKTLYSKENDNATEAQLDRMIDYQYSAIQKHIIDPANQKTLYDNETIEGLQLTESENITALEANTEELMANTYAYNQAQAKQINAAKDGMFGFDSSIAQLNTGWKDIMNGGAFKSGGFFDANSPVLSGEQEREDYGFSTELGPILAANMYEESNYAGSIANEVDGLERSLRRTFGEDTDRIISQMKYDHTDTTFDNFYGVFSSRQRDENGKLIGMEYNDIVSAQTFMTNNKEDLQKLGKSLYKEEKGAGWDKGKADKRVEKLLKGELKKGLKTKDKDLIAQFNKLSSRATEGINQSNILAMAQLQQFQDMYQVAQEQVAPGIMSMVQTGVRLEGVQMGISGSAGSASAGAQGAEANAAAIASLLGAQAIDAAIEEGFNLYKNDPSNDGKYTTKDEFQMAMARGELDPKYTTATVAALERTSSLLNNPDMGYEAATTRGLELAKQLEGADLETQLTTATWGIKAFAKKEVKNAYENSNIGEYGNGSSGSGGGSSGGGSGANTGSNQAQNVRNRVDLVLCNKKTIPKLNVNLFKKAPNFTVLNKNFKVRDIKINTQDKPKAMMNAIKNGIIDIQRRTDPKIIQDDEAVYDPTAATEGDNLPKGSTQTTT